MKQTAVEKMIQYFIEQKNNGASHWCINDLLGQLHQAKAMEKEQIIEAHFTSSGCNSFDIPTDRINSAYKAAQEYYIYTYEQI